MRGKISFCALLIGFSVVFGFLTSVAFAQPIQTWEGEANFTVKVTFLETDKSGNEKFKTQNNPDGPFEGTMSLYLGETGLVMVDGCFLRFLSHDTNTRICINNIADIATESTKSKSEQALLVGSGGFTKKIEGNTATGVTYIDAKATLKEDSSNRPTSATLTGKIGGGSNSSSSDFVFSANINIKLAPVAP